MSSFNTVTRGATVVVGATPADPASDTTSVLGVDRTDAGKCARPFPKESDRPFSIDSLPLCAVTQVTPCEATTTRLDEPFCLAA